MDIFTNSEKFSDIFTSGILIIVTFENNVVLILSSVCDVVNEEFSLLQ